MPPEGIDWKPKDQILTFGEIETIARILVKLGIRKIRLTGGEPLVRKEFEHLVAMLAKLENLETLAMTTNAIKLVDNVEKLKTAGIQALNISLDTMHADRFEKITGRDYLPRVLKAVEQSLEAGFESLKLNVVVMADLNDDEVLDFVAYAYDKRVNVRFIEFMPFKNNSWEITKVVTYKEMVEQISKKFTLIPLPVAPGAVAKDFAVEGGTGTVSFITSMSDSFCSTCNRLRLTADGSLKTCLFYPAEKSLRDLMREGASDAELERIIIDTVLQKPEEHPPAEEIASQENRSMIEIGG